MIVITGQIIRIELLPLRGLTLEKTSETPGLVTLRDASGATISLPADPREAQELARAYLEIAQSDVGYRRREHR